MSPERPHRPADHPKGPAACPDALRLAAWCDGRLDETDRATLDVHIATCPRCLELVEDLGNPCGSEFASEAPIPLVIAPDRIVRRATSLVPARAGWRFIASGLAASVAIAALGLWMGLRLGSAASTRPDADAASVASRSGSFGLLDDGRSDEGVLTDPLELVASRLLDGSTS